MRETSPAKVVFCGTPVFAVPTLEALIAAGHGVPMRDAADELSRLAENFLSPDKC